MRASLSASVLLSTTALFLVPALAQVQSTPTILLDPVVISSEGGNGTIVETTAGPVEGYRALTAGSATRTETPVEELPQNIQIIPQASTLR